MKILNLIALLLVFNTTNAQIGYIGKTQEETVKLLKSCCPETIIIKSNDDTLLVNRDGALALFIYNNSKVTEITEMFDLASKESVLKTLRERYSESVFGFFYKEFKGEFYLIDYYESTEDNTFTIRTYKETERIGVREIKN